MKKSYLIVSVFLLLSLFTVTASYAAESTTTHIDTKKIERTLIRESTPNYKIRASYPTFGEKSIDTAIQSVIDTSMKDFKQMSIEDEAASLGLQYEYYLTYRGVVTDSIRTIQLVVYQYTGGAHGATSLMTLYFDRATLLPLSLNSLFRSNTDYLKRLSSLTRDALVRELEPQNDEEKQWIYDGTEPTEDNFRDILVTNEGLRIVFGQYQVAPYAAGMPEVTISWRDLSDLLK